MKISVIIPSYNGAKKLPNILQALAKQSYQDFETIIVIDGSNDNSIEILTQNTNWELKDFKYITQPNGGRANVRNNGVKHATGNLLIFFDDDMRPQKDCVKKHLEHHNIYEQYNILVGNVPEDLEKMTTDFQQYRAKLSRIWVKDLSPAPFLMKTPFLTGANCSMTKATFELLGGFDQLLTDAEDFDLAVRAFEQKIPLYFDIDNVAFHDDFVSCNTYIKRLRQYRKSHQYLSALKPSLYQKYPYHTPSKLTFFKKIIYGFFAKKSWINTIDKGNWIKIFPQKIRYKIYDLATTALGTYFLDKEI